MHLSNLHSAGWYVIWLGAIVGEITLPVALTQCALPGDQLEIAPSCVDPDCLRRQW